WRCGGKSLETPGVGEDEAIESSLGGEFGIGDVAVDGSIQPVEVGTQRGVAGPAGGQDRAQAGTEDAGVDAREEEDGAETSGGEPVVMAAGDAPDEAVQAQASEVVGHPAGGHEAGVYAQQLSQGLAQVAIGETAGQEAEQDQGAEQGLRAR